MNYSDKEHEQDQEQEVACAWSASHGLLSKPVQNLIPSSERI